MCRAYINPFAAFIDAKHWKCNLCFRTNIGKVGSVIVTFFSIYTSVPDDYIYNPVTGKRGDRSHHQELHHASVEYIAPSEYMVCACL